MKVCLIGVCSGWGAQVRDTEMGFETLMNDHLLDFLQANHIEISCVNKLIPEKRAFDENVALNESLPLISELNKRICKFVEMALDRREFPIVIGGDHSIAVGTWNGVFHFFKKIGYGSMGLIWIDAHMDSHTLDTTPSGAWHGMPLAALMGYGEYEFRHIYDEVPLKPENLILIGIRSFEEGESLLLKKLGVKIYFDDEVQKKGISNVLQEAVEHLAKRVDFFGVSLDIDSITPVDAPGVGSPEIGGPKAKDLIDALDSFKNHEKFKAFELVEFNPKKDLDGKTLKICKEVLSKILDKN
jgi:arginase